MSRLTLQKNFYAEVSKGNVAGHSYVNKFGRNDASAANSDVWAGAPTVSNLYPFYPTTAKAMSIVSTNSADNAGGINARKVTVFGLDANWELQSEEVTLHATDGTIPVALANTYIRMYRAFVSEAGSSFSNIGNISVYETGVSTNVGAFIQAFAGQTQQCIYTIPAGKTGIFVKGYVGFANDNKSGDDCTFRWLMRINGTASSAWLVQGEIGLINIASSYWQYEYGIPAGNIPEKTDIRIYVLSVSDATSAHNKTVGGFDLLLVDN